MGSALKEYVNLTDGLSGDKHVTISSVLPLLYHIKQLDQEGDENAHSRLDKFIDTAVASYMLKRYEDESMKSFLIRATLLDPSYKNFIKTVYEDEVQYTAARLTLIEEMTAILDTDSTSDSDSTPTSTTPSSYLTQTQSGIKSLANILQGVGSKTAAGVDPVSTSNTELAREEIDRFLTCPILSTTSKTGGFNDPLLWWKKNQSANPVLSQLALSISAFLPPQYRQKKCSRSLPR